jgi:hypothetical protein
MGSVATARPSPQRASTPLVRKLGVREHATVLLVGAPDGYERWLAPLPAGVRFVGSASTGVDLAHVFVTRRADLARELTALRTSLPGNVPVWVSWPKTAANVATDVTEDVVRDVALPLGFVDVKVCAVDDVWSGLELVVRKALRR